MSSLSTSIYGSSTGKGVGGLLSGLDTDELVNQMTAATRNKINRQYQAKQKLLYRQEAYREISTKLLSFSNKYFSYSSGSKTNILSPNFFKAYTYKSSSNYVNVTGNADNIKNFEINEISSVASSASFASSKKVTSGEFQSGEITQYISSLAGETMTLEYDGKSYNITLDKDFGKGLEAAAGGERTLKYSDVVNELNEQLKKIEGNDKFEKLKYKLDSDEDGNYKIVLDKSEGRDTTAKLTAASTDITSILKMKVGQEASSSGGVVKEDLTLTAKDVFTNSEAYITLEFNGVTKSIRLSDMRTKNSDGTYSDNYTYDSKGLSEFLQKKINDEFGSGKVTVNYTGDKLTFKSNNDTDIFGVSSISKELSYFTGIESGDYNRVNKLKPLAESGIKGIENVATTTLSNGKEGYIININNVDIEIESTMSITDVINKINSNAEAGVKVYYSSTTDTFTVKATETGTHKGVSISAGENSLAQALFGSGTDLNEILKTTDEYIKTENGVMNFYSKNGDKLGKIEYNKESRQYTKNYDDEAYTDSVIATADYNINSGTDTEMTYTLNGVQSTITRSTANFTIDEINIELNEKASGLKKTDTPITFDVTNNSDEVVERVKQFIDEYNEIINLISTKTSEKPNRDYAPLNPEQQDEMKEEEIKNWTAEAKKGILFGDRNMTTVLRNMRGAMSGLTDVSSITLSSIGISAASMDTSGKLVLDETKFKEKLLENPDEIANLFTSLSSNTGTDAKSGIALQLQSILRANVGTYGTTGILIDEAGLSNSLTSDKNYISDKIEEYDDKMAELKKSLETERQRYWNQFTALETSLNKLNMQSSWLTDMMGQ